MEGLPKHKISHPIKWLFSDRSTLVLSFATLSSYAQITTTPTDSNKKEYYLIKKADGAEFIGEVLSDDGREVLLLTKNIGKIYITKSDITSM